MMNTLTSLGLILLLALLSGRFARVARIPAVTGYILAGVALGPSALGWVSERNLTALGVLSEIALGLILFSVGSIFEVSRFHRIGRGVVVLTLTESALAALLVTGGMLLLGQPWPVALLLGVVAIETAPASTLMVIRETESQGPLTDCLLGLIAVNNLICLTCYSLAATAIDLSAGVASSQALPQTLYWSFFALVWQLFGSVALGYLVGLLLTYWSKKVRESGEMLILLAGSILLSVGAAHVLELSSLIASMTVGATIVNLTQSSRRLIQALSGTEPPYYAIFFVLAGAALDVTLVWSMGLAGVAYIVGRAAGKVGGARLGARRLRLDAMVQRFLGFALLTQAGLAIGLTLAIDRRFPSLGPVVSTIVLASVVIHEVVGPLGVRFALLRSGEAKIPLRDSRLTPVCPPRSGSSKRSRSRMPQ